ncbi:hypothetical protein A9P82_07740 [Arachidicoccus ginsenosidimutans]|uniref:hypothetical protein n=1 Tax=Arachidicoccus sp. BS20 TaxID=1850526 RepID=UPI0007F0BCC2|nr:hypothetical protein [Arachidicoccus sp. BS20]ANI89191.1 hypothetical protein A9P82_07740 [Arachidicoccus sp. BS20]
MSILRYLNRLVFIDYLVKRKATGDLQTFANKNGLSKSHMELTLKEMKEMGFPIKYDRNLHTYYYEKDGEMVKSFFINYDEEETPDKKAKTRKLNLNNSEDVHILSREEAKKVTSSTISLSYDINNLCYSPTMIFQPCVK